MIASRRSSGTTSRRSSSSLAGGRSADRFDRPVRLPPGRAKFATRPVPTGSPAVAKTIGMTDVACFAARIAMVPPVTMTSTFSRTNSAAMSAKRSLRPSAQRYSIATVRPSTQPSSRSRCTNASVHLRMADSESWPRNPMVGILPTRCASAVNGQITAAPPMAAINSRRRIEFPVGTPRRRLEPSTLQRCEGEKAQSNGLDCRVGTDSYGSELVHPSRRPLTVQPHEIWPNAGWPLTCSYSRTRNQTGSTSDRACHDRTDNG